MWHTRLKALKSISSTSFERNVSFTGSSLNKSLLRYPVKGMASTLEERQFVNRFDSFFTGEKAFAVNIQAKEIEQLKADVASKEHIIELLGKQNIELKEQVKTKQIRL